MLVLSRTKSYNQLSYGCSYVSPNAFHVAVPDDVTLVPRQGHIAPSPGIYSVNKNQTSASLSVCLLHLIVPSSIALLKRLSLVCRRVGLSTSTLTRARGVLALLLLLLLLHESGIHHLRSG